ncbi:glutathione reductase [Nadsonia fulvescens var. elongata DSM 6958]|uniref:Glutathione reductase n=1 Tax=Nadsonia fulvescens var. elongata DSM 6958 TaxID=857566 RepID=A0A1E3PIM0_9ASCO|nr:glutathione reductase [Nadsonia fulvescens var. elongata DSM 6958]
MLRLRIIQVRATTRKLTFTRWLSTASSAPKAHYDYLVIGGGSGGIASARRAASYGAKTLVIESEGMGGTCVNVGCVPKKVMWYASEMAARLDHASDYGLSQQVTNTSAVKFDWPEFKAKRDAYIHSLNGMYENSLTKEGVEYVTGHARFAKATDSSTQGHLIEVTTSNGVQNFTADKVLVATGGKSVIPDVIGAEYGITSDGFFALEEQPARVAIVGAGYIGTELAGIFRCLGSETHLFIRGQTLLRNFDPMIQSLITDHYIHDGVKVHKDSRSFERVEKLDSGSIKITYEDDLGKQSVEVDALIWTIGRRALSDQINLAVTDVKLNLWGQIVVNEWQETNVHGIYSLGDVVGKVELTPVAIATGRKLSDRLFGGNQFAKSKQDFTGIPSAVFSHPEIGSIGLTEPEARTQYGDAQIKVYQSKFTSMYYAMIDDPAKRIPTAYKLICAGPEQKIVGLHIMGDGSSEILQGFSVAIKMGATKADFDSCVAIHPTAAEEIVTMR